MRRLVRISLAVAGLCAGLALTAQAAGYSTRDALGAVVASCTLNKAISGSAFPCYAVETGSGEPAYALVRPPRNPTEVLLVPTEPLAGIEAPVLRDASGAGYWQAAWAARGVVAQALGRPLDREQIGLAVNSSHTRTQDRLHIHVDCLGAIQQRAFSKHKNAIDDQWRPFPVRFEGRVFWVRSVAGDDLANINPVALMLDGLPMARRLPAAMSLAVVGATLADGSPGFYLLAEQARRNIGGSGATEDLLDHACRAG